jgi:hypothetical protein
VKLATPNGASPAGGRAPSCVGLRGGDYPAAAAGAGEPFQRRRGPSSALRNGIITCGFVVSLGRRPAVGQEDLP